MKSELPILPYISVHPKSHFSERLSENLMIMMYTYSEERKTRKWIFIRFCYLLTRMEFEMGIKEGKKFLRLIWILNFLLYESSRKMFIPQFKLRLKGYLEMWENLCNFISKVLMCILFIKKWSAKMFVDKAYKIKWKTFFCCILSWRESTFLCCWTGASLGVKLMGNWVPN